MKRVKAACLEQTIHFQLKEELPKEVAVKDVHSELEAYKAQLEHKHTKFKVVAQSTLEDGSILLKIKKQYNSYDCGDYLA